MAAFDEIQSYLAPRHQKTSKYNRIWLAEYF